MSDPNPDKFFYTVNNAQNGPVSLAELKTMASRGQLKRTDKVWKKGMPSWESASSIPEIFEDLPPDLNPSGSYQAGVIPPPLPTETSAGLWVAGAVHSPRPATPPRKIFTIIGIAACVMVLFPPVSTFNAPLVAEDKGIEWQLRGGSPNLVVLDTGGLRDKRFAFILSLGENDKILFPQLVFQLIALAGAGLVIVAWQGKSKSINEQDRRKNESGSPPKL